MLRRIISITMFSVRNLVVIYHSRDTPRPSDLAVDFSLFFSNVRMLRRALGGRF